MARAYQITLPDNSSVQVVPNDNAEQALVTIDDYNIVLSKNDDGHAAEIVHGGSSVISKSAIDEVDATVENLADEGATKSVLGKTCIDCQGRTYCVTNACANTPCGWICG